MKEEFRFNKLDEGCGDEQEVRGVNVARAGELPKEVTSELRPEGSIRRAPGRLGKGVTKCQEGQVQTGRRGRDKREEGGSDWR